MNVHITIRKSIHTLYHHFVCEGHKDDWWASILSPQHFCLFVCVLFTYVSLVIVISMTPTRLSFPFRPGSLGMRALECRLKFDTFQGDYLCVLITGRSSFVEFWLQVVCESVVFKLEGFMGYFKEY